MEVWARRRIAGCQVSPLSGCFDLSPYRHAPQMRSGCRCARHAVWSLSRDRFAPNREHGGSQHRLDIPPLVYTPLVTCVQPTSAVGLGTVEFSGVARRKPRCTIDPAMAISADVSEGSAPDCDCEATDARLQHQCVRRRSFSQGNE